MKNRFARASVALLIISILLLVLLTAFESALSGMSTAAERILTFLLLVLPAGVGAALGILSLIRREERAWLAGLSAGLNGLFALFHSILLLFAG